MRKYTLLVLWLLLIIAVSSACGGQKPASTPPSEESVKPPTIESSTPTLTPRPTNTPQPTSTPVPTKEPVITPTIELTITASFTSDQSSFLTTQGIQVADLLFYERGSEAPSREEIVYSNSFVQESTRFIKSELRLEHPGLQGNVDLIIDFTLQGPGGTNSGALESSISDQWTYSWHQYGWGQAEPGKWKPGVYTVEIFVQDELIASDTFKITQADEE